ncbi:RDD family protein [Solirubrobacter taibaiensis]|nr:RDD family protein [Solirubrobacter taibaiensis]
MAQRYGSWGARAGALILDGLIVGVLLIVVLGLLEGALGLGGLLSWLVSLIVLGTYTGLTMTRSGERNGQTFGKQAANIRVVRDNGEPVTLKTVALREVGLKGIGWWITFGVGWLADVLWPLGEGEKRSLHDLIVRTHVMDTSPAPQPQTPLHWAPPMPQLAPPIAAHLNAAYGLRGRIVALDASLADDITVIVGALQTSAGRAQQLWDALSETSPEALRGRIANAEQAGKTELVEALRQQQAVNERMDSQLNRYRDEFERVLAELETIRGHLVSASASTDNDNRENLTATVRALRDETHALAAGTMAAYGEV